MPIIGRQCTRDLKTVCQRMSEAALSVNHDGPGLTLAYGWSSEERRAQGVPAAIQGIDFSNSSGKVLPLELCPWCGAKIASSPTTVRPPSTSSTPRAEPTPPAAAARPAPSEAGHGGARFAPEAAPAPASAPGSAPEASGPLPSLKALRERLGLSQAELGEKLGLARSSIANYENGRAPLSQRLRKWMAKHEKKLADRG